jgi:hypothetical protein
MKNKIKNLVKILEEQLDKIINEFNNHIDDKFEEFFLTPFSEYFKDSKTQEITKIISPTFNAILCKVLKPYGFYKCENNGSDYDFDGILIEGKITSSKDNSWTGNGYYKTNWHLLIKLKLNCDGMIDSIFCALIPLDECVSKWTAPSNKSNFSGLKIENVDYSKMIIIRGDVEIKTKHLSIILL